VRRISLWPGVDGKDYTLNSSRIQKVIVSCSPATIALTPRPTRTPVNIQRDFDAKGVQFVAINPNDSAGYPETVPKTWSSAPKKAIYSLSARRAQRVSARLRRGIHARVFVLNAKHEVRSSAAWITTAAPR